MVCTRMPTTALGRLAVIDTPIALLESLEHLAVSSIPLVSLRSVGVLRTEFATLDYDPEDTLLEFVRRIRSIVSRLRCECLALPPPQQPPGPSPRRVLGKVTSLEGWANPKLLLLQVLAKRFDAILTDNVVITKTHVESALADLQTHHHRERNIAQAIAVRRMAHKLASYRNLRIWVLSFGDWEPHLETRPNRKPRKGPPLPRRCFFTSGAATRF
jgi:hypothetical protein